MRILGMVSSLFIVFASLGTADQFRGVWVDAFGPGFFNSQEVSNLVSDCRKYNFNAVFVEMRARGNAFYMPGAGNGDVRRSVLSTNYDALAEIVRQCRAGTPRIEVHCWVSAQYVWASPHPPLTKQHVFNLHPEYLTKDSVGQTFIGKGYFLDPGNPDACQWNHDMAIDIVSHYDIDGFHWDYLRYPNQNSGYNETALARYKSEFSLTGQPSPKDGRFCAWRRRQLTDFLRWVDSDMLAINPHLIISASVFANIDDAFNYRFQDWPKWNSEGVLDLCFPMDFTTNAPFVFNPRADFALTNQGVRRVYVGVGAYLNPSSMTLQQIDYLLARGAMGYCLYSYRLPCMDDSKRGQTLEFIKNRFQPTWSPVPELLWKRKATTGIIKGTVWSKRERRALYNVELDLDRTKNNSVKTEPHGKFAFFDVSEGIHTVFAKISQKQIFPEKVNVISGQVTTLNFFIP